ncbi:DUF317 domain-containing protein [Streptomyces sp. NPDC088141]|uniref:DUF317 domain-containing protein n=1 Tax=Streptomyces sp. NPDC088141 TaxID=3155179 RepID=UPI003449A7F5
MSRSPIYIPSCANEPSGRIQFATRPRHLAGRGDPRHITQPLRASGWKNHSDPDLPHVVLASPDYQQTLVLDPEADTWAPWWRIRSEAESGYWAAEFGGEIPVEVLAGFTDALIRPVPDQAPSVWPLLTDAGWAHEQNLPREEAAHHLGGILHLRRWTVSEGESYTWTAEAMLPTGLGGHRALWRAYFSDRTPPHLLAGFVTALVSNEPVQRGMYAVPHHHLVTQEQTGPQAEALIAAHTERLKAARSVARAARRSTGLPAQPAPVPAAATAYHR